MNPNSLSAGRALRAEASTPRADKRPGGFARSIGILAAALLAGLLGLVAPAVAAPAAQAATVCADGSIYANVGSGRLALNEYSTTGTLLNSVPLTRDYYDIAFLSDGTTLYGVRVNVLWRIDPTTGQEISGTPITGLPANYDANALSALPTGDLLTGTSNSTEIFQINPTTGVATPFRASFPPGFGSAGDFLSLNDGDILAVGTGTNVSTLFRIKPDNSVIEVGTVPTTYGAAQSGNVIYLPSGGGEIYAVRNLPTTASAAPIPVDTLASTGLVFFGATAPQDSGLCAGLTLEKTVAPAAAAPYAAGQAVTFSFRVTNSGNTPVRDVAVDETAFTGTGQLGPISPSTSGSLAPGASTTFTASYVLTQADVDAGVVTNTAEATATYFQRSTITSQPSTAALPIQAAGSLSLQKSASPAGLSAYTVGQNITYTFDVRNTGNVTVKDVAIREDAFTGSGVMSAPTPATVAALAPGEATVFTATYTLTQGDIDRGTTSNTATATGTARGIPVTSAASRALLSGTAAPSLALDKTAAPAPGGAFHVGDQISYRFTVANTGNVTVTGVGVTEGAFTGTGTMGAVSPSGTTTLAPGESTVFTATYTATSEDATRGSVSNTATASGTAPGNVQTVSAPSTAVARIAALPVPQPSTSPTPASAGRANLAVTGGNGAMAPVLIGAALLLVVAGSGVLVRARRRRL